MENRSSRVRIKKNTKPVCSRPYPLLKVQEEFFKKDAECLFLMEALERENYSKWGAPFFAEPKPKINLVCFLSEFIE